MLRPKPKTSFFPPHHKACPRLQSGDTEKGNAQLAVAELKARIALAGNPPELAYDYASAKVALEQGNYGEAQRLSKETMEKIPQGDANNLLITIIVIIIIVVIFGFFIYTKKKVKSIVTDQDQIDDYN